MLGRYTTGPALAPVSASGDVTRELACWKNRLPAGVLGLEPRLTEPESGGLPITPYPSADRLEPAGSNTTGTTPEDSNPLRGYPGDAQPQCNPGGQDREQPEPQ